MILGTASLVVAISFVVEDYLKKGFISYSTNFLSKGINNDNDKESLLSLKPPSDFTLLFIQFNNTSPEKNNDPEKWPSGLRHCSINQEVEL